MITLKSPVEIALMEQAGTIVAEALQVLRAEVQPGVATARLNDIAAEVILSHAGARPAFQGYRGFPAALCVSINDEVVHGIPHRERRIKSGDIVGLDLGACLDGYYADAAITVPVGTVSPAVCAFLETAERALARGIAAARPDGYLGEISAAIQEEVEAEGYSVVRALVGHGIGTALHEEPQVPNFGRRGEGPLLQEGLVLAIEPMINMGGFEVLTLPDSWTVVTADGSLSAHYEHTVAITASGARVLTNSAGAARVASPAVPSTEGR